ncbi:Na/Pi symporter [Algoriphagus mannitolivorans]|uniref:Na/Pi symporter n=1 Tax=Algoriphagus mannitolivorans TaxID=226504 RepID=UPI0003F60FE1|nr:Na/Pi symporter [Algoriphagus mannitolivorans]
MENLDPQKSNSSHKARNLILIVLGLILFIFSIDLLTVAMAAINTTAAEEILQATRNPFISLFIGLLVTALIQSSSTVTASIVAIVASGNMSLQQAVPMVLGANIGTTLTSTLVSFSYLMEKKEFRRALSAGILHDMFNILTVMILLPLEVYFGFLSGLSQKIAGLFSIDDSFEGPIVYNKLFTRPITEWIIDHISIPFLTMILAVFLVFGAIKILSTAMYRSFVLNSFNNINNLIFKKTGLAFLYGTFFTALVQSSTVTTSLVVPLVANRRVSLAKSFPFIIGANIGTTITAVIASLYKSEAAIALAIVHILFNSIGALIFLPFPEIRKIPVRMASFMGKKSVDNRILGFAYILLMFFIIPFLLIYFSRS